MLLHAYAKINWALDTVGLRDDGYHLLDTIMQSVSLHDDITIELDSKLSLSVVDAPHVPNDESNLILRTAEALRQHTGTTSGAHITLRKRIPVVRLRSKSLPLWSVRMPQVVPCGWNAMCAVWHSEKR